MPVNWTPPVTWVTDELVTATKLNEQVRDNLEFLKSPPTTTVTFTGGGSTTSTSPVEIDPALTFDLTTEGGAVLIGFNIRRIKQSTAGQSITVTLYVNGNGTPLIQTITPANTADQSVCGVLLLDTLAAGTHNFSLRWSVSGGTATIISTSGYASFFAREV